MEHYMFEFHGWINVDCADAANHTPCDVSTIKKMIDDKKDPRTKFELFYQQGKPYISINGCLENYHGWVLQLFNQIAQFSQSSEGLLFMRDTENTCFDGNFAVWQISDGEVYSGEMTFFPHKFNDLHLHSNNAA
jgi:hypothetical protein